MIINRPQDLEVTQDQLEQKIASNSTEILEIIIYTDRLSRISDSINKIIILLNKINLITDGKFSIDVDFTNIYAYSISNYNVEQNLVPIHWIMHFLQQLKDKKLNNTVTKVMIQGRMMSDYGLSICFNEYFKNLTKLTIYDYNVEQFMKEWMNNKQLNTFKHLTDLKIINLRLTTNITDTIHAFAAIGKFITENKKITACDVLINQNYVNNCQDDCLQSFLHYTQLQKTITETMEERVAALSKLEICLENIKYLKDKIQILDKTTDFSNDRIKLESELEDEEEIFRIYARILKEKNNNYVYYYLAKYEMEVAENTNYKTIFDYLDKVTPPLNSDPEKATHGEIYRLAQEWQGAICLDQTQYAQIDQRDIEEKRIKLAIKFYLKAKNYITANNIIQEYFGDAYGSSNTYFAEVDSGENAIDLMWPLVESYKRKVTAKQEPQTTDTANNIVRFSTAEPRKLTQLTVAPTTLEKSKENTNPNKRSHNFFENI